MYFRAKFHYYHKCRYKSYITSLKAVSDGKSLCQEILLTHFAKIPPAWHPLGGCFWGWTKSYKKTQGKFSNNLSFPRVQ